MEPIGLIDFYVIYGDLYSPPFVAANNITYLSYDYKSNLITLTARQ